MELVSPIMRFKDVEMRPQGSPHPSGKQAILDFGKYQLSIISNDMSYGGAAGLYEIGLFEGGKMVKLPGITREDDCVDGYLTPGDVTGIMLKLFLITKKAPIQIERY